MLVSEKKTSQVWRWDRSIKRDQHWSEVTIYWFAAEVERKSPLILELKCKTENRKRRSTIGEENNHA